MPLLEFHYELTVFERLAEFSPLNAKDLSVHSQVDTGYSYRKR